MKKFFLIIAAVMGAFAANAQAYRGFVEISGGFGASNGVTPKYMGSQVTPDAKLNMMIGVSTTHGFQALPMLYAGIGIGAYMPIYKGESNGNGFGIETNNEMNGLTLPVYLDVRWDLDVRKKVTPFVNLKVGYQIGMTIDEGAVSENYSGSDDYNAYLAPGNGFYFEPSVGIRFRTSDHKGVNLSLSYNPCVCTQYELWRGYKDEMAYNGSGKLASEKKNFGVVMVNVGFDF